MTLGSILTQIFRPAVHQLKQAHRVATHTPEATGRIRTLLSRINNGDFNVGCAGNAARGAKRNLDGFKAASQLSLSDARKVISDAREIRRDMKMQLKQARNKPGGADSWNRDRARELQKIHDLADRLVHFRPTGG